jgi:hypothetical protein
MDVLGLRRQYERLADDEIMRLWADQDGLTEIASSVLSEEITRRGLLNNPRASARLGELKQELSQNKRRFERHQKWIMWRSIVFVIGCVVTVIVAIARLWFWSK